MKTYQNYWLMLLNSSALLLFLAPNISGQEHAGIFVNGGNVPFADRIVDYSPGSNVSGDWKQPDSALGPPQLVSPGGYPRDVSLGNGGSLTIEFENNDLRNGVGADLAVFEVGSEAERFEVEISADGSSWIQLGSYPGGARAIDIGPFVDSPGPYKFVRVTDAPGGGSGNPYAGADIDAIATLNGSLCQAVRETFYFSQWFKGAVCGSVSEDLFIGEIEDELGGKIQLWCLDKGQYVDEFGLFYVSPRGERIQIGRCPWEAGCNLGSLLHGGDPDGDGKPDCFLRSAWISADQKYGDEDDDPDKDVYVALYDFSTKSLTERWLKEPANKSVGSPPLVVSSKTSLYPGSDHVLGGPVGIVSDSGLPMRLSEFHERDLNADGKIDAEDGLILGEMMGMSSSDGFFYHQADYDGSGEIDDFDREIFSATNSYTEWIAQNFPQSWPDPSRKSVWGQDADPDGDGCVNRIEFLMLRNPNLNDRHLGLKARIDGGKLVLSFRENTQLATSYSLIAEYSDSMLGAWGRGHVSYRTTERFNGYRLVEATLHEEGDINFIRLRSNIQH